MTLYTVVYSKKYNHSGYILHTRVEKVPLLKAAHDAPEYGEGLDPFEEEGDELGRLQEENEILHHTFVFTLQVHPVSQCQVFLQKRNSPGIYLWDRTLAVKNGFPQFQNIFSGIQPCLYSKVSQIRSYYTPDISCCQTSKSSHLKGSAMTDTMIEFPIAGQYTGPHAGQAPRQNRQKIVHKVRLSWAVNIPGQLHASEPTVEELLGHVTE